MQGEAHCLEKRVQAILLEERLLGRNSPTMTCSCILTQTLEPFDVMRATISRFKVASETWHKQEATAGVCPHCERGVGNASIVSATANNRHLKVSKPAMRLLKKLFDFFTCFKNHACLCCASSPRKALNMDTGGTLYDCRWRAHRSP